MDEGVLERVGGLQRLVALDQRPLDLHRVGDVDEGHHGLAVGQRHGGVVDHPLVGALHPAGDARPALVEPGDAGGEARPRSLSSSPGCRHGPDDVGDMRLAVEDRRVEAEDGGEGRIVEPEPAVGAEHRDAFGEVVEGLALDVDQRVVAALEVEPLGDVLVDPGHPALRVGIGDDAERLAVGQVPALFPGLDRPVGGEQLGPPRLGSRACSGSCARRAAGRARRCSSGCEFEEGGVEAEQAAIGGVVRLEPPVRPEDGDRRGELVEGAGVEVDLAAERRLGRLDAPVTSTAMPPLPLGRGDVDDVEDAALAGDDRRQALDEDRVGCGGRRRSMPRPALSSSSRPRASASASSSASTAAT